MLMRNGEGSIPEMIMRTGVMYPMATSAIRRDIQPRNVIDMTSMATGIASEYDEQPSAAQTPTTIAVAQAATATPPTPIPAPSAPVHGGVLLGQIGGRPVAHFNVNASPARSDAQGAVLALKRAAQAVQHIGHGALPPELVGGPMAALMRGGVVVLHFTNGVVARTAL